MSDLGGYFRCRCHEDWLSPNKIHRVPIDCQPKSAKELVEVLRQEVIELRAEVERMREVAACVRLDLAAMNSGMLDFTETRAALARLDGKEVQRCECNNPNRPANWMCGLHKCGGSDEVQP